MNCKCGKLVGLVGLVGLVRLVREVLEVREVRAVRLVGQLGLFNPLTDYASPFPPTLNGAMVREPSLGN